MNMDDDKDEILEVVDDPKHADIKIQDEKDDDQDDQDDSQEDARLDDDRESDEESLRAERRQQRKLRRNRSKVARDKTREEMQMLMRQNQELMQRLNHIESRTVGFEQNHLDSTYNSVLYTIRQAEDELAKAIQLGEGEKVPEILRRRDKAMAEAAEINRMKSTSNANYSNGGSTSGQSQNNVVDSRVRNAAEEWANNNDWFDPSGRDEDSAVVLALDKQLTARGLNPASKGYWKELDKLVERYLPHRFDNEDEVGYNDSDEAPARTGRKSPPVGSSRDNSAPGTKKVYVSPDRRRAMEEAGVWDDPVLRTQMLKRYAEWDKSNRAGR